MLAGFTELLNEWGQVLAGQLDAGSLTAIFIVYAAGLVTSLTPCVYPMIPVTVTFIGGAAGGDKRRAVVLSLFYLLGMSVVYTGLGIVSASLGLMFGRLTQSPWVQGGVGLLIILFGIAMLDWVTIPIPGFAGKVQTSGVQRGGFFGAVLMGLAAGLVAAPCTAPVMGALLAYVGSEGNVLWGGTLLFFFSLGLGTLLVLLGIFSGLLTSLPAAGKWMDWIKKGFGVAMLLIGVAFLYSALKLIMGWS